MYRVFTVSPILLFPLREALELIPVVTLANTGTFDIREELHSPQAIRQRIVARRVKVGIIVPSDFSANLLRGEPATVQVPVTYYVEILRGIILRGAGFQALWSQTVVLAVFAVALVAASAARFQKRLG